MSVANPLWGARRIHGELLKLGMDVGQTTAAKYMAKRRRPPSQGWRTFVHDNADAIASIDMFVVPTIGHKSFTVTSCGPTIVSALAPPVVAPSWLSGAEDPQCGNANAPPASPRMRLAMPHSSMLQAGVSESHDRHKNRLVPHPKQTAGQLV
jgi:hypothetical protein